MRLAVVGLLLAIGIAFGCSSDSDSAQPSVPAQTPDGVAVTPTPVEPGPDVPRFVPATGDLLALVGSEFGESDMPPRLAPDPVGGGALINTAANPSDDELVGLFWKVGESSADFVLTRVVDRDDSGSPRWRIADAWQLLVPPGSLVTVGTHICFAPADSFDSRNGELIAVTNAAADSALGAWTMTAAGPTPYAELATLRCQPIEA